MNKKFRQFKWFAATLMLVAAMVMPSVAWADGSITPSKPKTGDGSAASPYQIGTAAELYWFAGLVNGDTNVCNFNADTNPEGTQQNKAACAVLTANIVVNSGLVDCNTMLGSLEYDTSGNVTNGSNFVAWTPIGFNYQNYIGTFDGKGYTVSGLYFNDTSKEKVGLFGRVDSGGKISNVGVLDSYFQFRMQGGGICGLNYGEINNCTNDGTVIGNSTGSGAGGVCGMNYGTVKDCKNTGSVSGTVSRIGGVCGFFDSGSIENCLNEGTVSGTNDYTGGVCGYAGGGAIKRSYNTASVSGLNGVGGVCGDNGGATLEDCYNTGNVGGSKFVGGVCGDYSSGYTIKNCYNTGAVSGQNNVGGVCGLNSSSTITNCYYLSGTATGGINGEDATGSAESKSADKFRSGEVCYLLNNGMTDGSQVWYQTLSGSGEGYPNLNKDTENRTVYAGYRHSETTPYCSNTQSNIPSGYGHLHAYNSDASDEANGNHDMSYEQNEQNPYTWTDIDNYSNATAKCNFICSVCNSEVSKDMTVTHNEEKTNEPAKCMEKGYNYYVASLTFNGTTYTEYKTQEVPALGHDDSGDVTFNSGYKIYEKHCNRDKCDVLLGYYATSDGMVEATYEDGEYKVPIFCLNDGLAYDNEAKFTVESLEYKRMYYDDKWAAVYVPFAIDCSQLPNSVEMAVINNFHEYEQEDGSYNVVLEVKRKTSGTIPALTPCVIRLKTAPWEGVETLTMRFSNAMFSPAADKYIDCSSVTRYYKFSGSLAKIEEGLLVDGRDFVLNEGTLYKANPETTLKAQRWYLSAEDRAGSSTSSATKLNCISLRVIGDSDGDATGIEDVHVVTEKASSARKGIFDLQGRQLNSEPARGLFIKNGVKYVKQ